MISPVFLRFADEIASIVDAGENRLDSLLDFDWRKSVEADELVMQSVNNCLLTQLFGGYKRGLDLLHVELGEVFGFDIPASIYDADVQEEVYEMLTSEWVGRLGIPA